MAAVQVKHAGKKTHTLKKKKKQPKEKLKTYGRGKTNCKIQPNGALVELLSTFTAQSSATDASQISRIKRKTEKKKLLADFF